MGKNKNAVVVAQAEGALLQKLFFQLQTYELKSAFLVFIAFENDGFFRVPHSLLMLFGLSG